MIIYKATNKINNKVYIGQTRNSLRHRSMQHLRETQRSDRIKTYFHNAILKYGFDNFIFEIIDWSNDTLDLDSKEKYWIKFYNSTDKNYGYNLDSGGKSCTKSEETKRKIGQTSKIKWSNPEIADKMRAGLRKATKVWIEDCKKRRIDWTCPICGKVLKLTRSEAKQKKFCSRECAGRSPEQLEKLRRLAQEKHRLNLEKKSIIKKDILLWCRQNPDIILQCPYNKITSSLKPLLDYVDCKDMRNLFVCFNVKNRKEFLTYLKNFLIKENIC